MERNVRCYTTPVQRSKGHSAVGGAAYRAGVNLKARGQGEDGKDKWFRYSPKGIVVREAFIMRPEGSPDYTADRGELWNGVEEMETNKRARLGRDVELGFAYELNHDEQRALVREFAQREFVDKGFIVDVAIHNYGRTLPAIGGSEDNKQKLRDWAQDGIPFVNREDAEGRSDVHVMEMTNRDGAVTGYKLYQPHAHVRVTPRPVVEGDFATDKYAGREFNSHKTAMAWRYEWPKLQNQYLEAAGSDVRVTCTSSREDQYPELELKGNGTQRETQAVEDRAHELSDEQRDRHDDTLQVKEADEQFRRMHNEAMIDAFNELEGEGGSTTEQGEQTRLALWWHRQSERFSQWRHDFKDVAEEWRDRLGHHKHRIKQVLGLETPDFDDERPGTQIAPHDVEQQPPPEQDIGEQER